MGIPSRFDPEVSFEIERVAVRAWPAEEVEEVEGWVLRRTEGVGRRRSNSLLPPAEGRRAVRTVEMALAVAEEMDFPLVVQVSPAEVHLALDEALEDRGFGLGGATLVLAGALQARRPQAAVAVEVGPLSRGWVEAWGAVSGDREAAEATAELVLTQLREAGGFALVVDHGRPVAVAIGVVEGRWLGVFSLTVAPGARRRGVALAVMDALEAWGVAKGATDLYLQVEADNEAALALYAGRGLTIAHSYHYRSA